MHLSQFSPKSRWPQWGLLFALGLLLCLGIASWQAQSSVRPLAPPLPQDPNIQVFFNQSQASVYQEPYRKLTRHGDNLEQVIIDAIAAAQFTIDVAIQELNLPLVAEALSDRARAGVRVRIILENSYAKPWSERNPAKLTERDRAKYEEFMALADRNRNGRLSPAEIEAGDALKILQMAQIPVLDDTADGSKGSGLMHHKFVVIDQNQVVTGSANFTTSGIHGDALEHDSRGNANVLLKILNSTLAKHYSEEFELMWGDGPRQSEDSLFGLQKPFRAARSVIMAGASVKVQFSPTSKRQPWAKSVNGLISDTLARSQRSIDLALFVFSDQAIGNRLYNQHQAGVQVRSLIDPGFIYRSYSEGLDMLGLSLPDHRCQYENQNQPWQQPILAVGTPQLATGDKLHHKFALIDDDTVIVGSQNWSKAGNQENDENLLVITNDLVAAHFRREFERLYSKAALGITPKLETQIAKQRKACQT
ncbi:MAG: phospholipase D-like domain-containing protein [Cyanobacteria bacterium J06635_15]